MAHTTGEPRSKSHRDGLVCSEEESGARGQAEEQGPADRLHQGLLAAAPYASGMLKLHRPPQESCPIHLLVFITGGRPRPKLNPKYEAILEAKSKQAVNGFAGVEAETGLEAELPLVSCQCNNRFNTTYGIHPASFTSYFNKNISYDLIHQNNILQNIK